MVRIAVGSTNRAKIEAVRRVFVERYPVVDIVSLGVASSVPSQPVNGQTFEGAQHRAEELRKLDKDGSCRYYVGIEGGIVSMHSRWFQVDAACIIDSEGGMAFGMAPSFEVPPRIVDRLRKGEELSCVLDEILSQTNTKETGMIKFLSKGKVDKTAHLAQGVEMALFQLMNKGFYSSD
jgi:inosine/xanthosine triphosphatase